MIYILWEFNVSPQHRREFEIAYRSDGVWVELFRRDPAYVKTILVKNAAEQLRGSYLTIDVWRSREAYSQFKDRFAEDYSQIDKLCESLTESERFVGIFEELP